MRIPSLKLNTFKHVGLFVGVAFIISSCNNQAVEYNNALVKIQLGVLPQVQSFAKKWSANVDSSNMHNILPEAKQIVQLLDQKIAALTTLPVVEGSQNLKTAIQDQLEFERNLCYKLGRLGDPNVTSEEKAAIEAEFIKTAPDADRITARVTETQKEFAQKNHFTLQNK